MKQYLQLLKDIKMIGVHKEPARENMPGTTSLFAYQLRHNLQEGFPLLTTKKMAWKGIVVELLWFLRGDTNIKFLDDNGVTYMWHQDAYNYYLKKCDEYERQDCVPKIERDSFEYFLEQIKKDDLQHYFLKDYKWGDCGFQYGKVWRAWEGGLCDTLEEGQHFPIVDQIKNVIKSLKETPMSRRHIVTAWDPAHDQDLALTWCHAMFQFNCRPLTLEERVEISGYPYLKDFEEQADEAGVPKYYLDCQLYQRSADVVLGVPFNIASYALLTHIIAEMCNMIPGQFIHTFGDVHIYDNHKEAVEEHRFRTPTKLPKLKLEGIAGALYSKLEDLGLDNLNRLIDELSFKDFKLDNYNPQPAIKAELSTGMKKQERTPNEELERGNQANGSRDSFS